MSFFSLFWERELVSSTSGGFAPWLLIYFTGHFRANEMRRLSRKQSNLLSLTLHSTRRLIPSNALRTLLSSQLLWAKKDQIAHISDRYKDKMNIPPCKIIHNNSTLPLKMASRTLAGKYHDYINRLRWCVGVSWFKLVYI